jgi:hypothetical protein
MVLDLMQVPVAAGRGLPDLVVKGANAGAVFPGIDIYQLPLDFRGALWLNASTIDYHPASLRDLGETSMEMDKWSFGLTMMIIGMGGTFLTLWVLSLVIDVLKKVFPLADKAGADKK